MTLAELTIRVDKLPKQNFIIGKKKLEDGKEVTPVYYKMTVAIQDDTRHGSNVSAWDSQTAEQRDNKIPRTYISASGRVYWTNGIIRVAEKQKK